MYVELQNEWLWPPHYAPGTDKDILGLSNLKEMVFFQVEECSIGHVWCDIGIYSVVKIVSVAFADSDFPVNVVLKYSQNLLFSQVWKNEKPRQRFWCPVASSCKSARDCRKEQTETFTFFLKC